MSFHKFIDEEIKKAIEAGEFDNLGGAGRPLDLTAYFNTPEEFRIGYSVLKSSKFAPEEVERLREIGELKEKITKCKIDEEKAKLIKILRERELAFAILMERNKTRKR